MFDSDNWQSGADLMLTIESDAGAIGDRIPSDPVLTHLYLAVRAASAAGGATHGIYAHAVRLANAARESILQQSPRRSRSGDDDAGSGGLAKWRLKRVVAFVNANLADPISLADMAAAASYSPMHFAALFRASTGMRPHEFLVRRRIALGCRLLQETNDRLVDIALASGFQTQAHFTTVFKRLVGETPCRWRSRQQLAGKAPQSDSLDMIFTGGSPAANPRCDAHLIPPSAAPEGRWSAAA